MKTTETTPTTKNFSKAIFTSYSGKQLELKVSVDTFLNPEMIGPGTIECYWAKELFSKRFDMQLQISMEIVHIETDDYLAQTYLLSGVEASMCILDIPEGVQVRDLDFCFLVKNEAIIVNPQFSLSVPAKQEEFTKRIKVAVPFKQYRIPAQPDELKPYSVYRTGPSTKSNHSNIPTSPYFESDNDAKVNKSFDFVEASNKMDKILLQQKIDSLIASGAIKHKDEYWAYMLNFLSGLGDNIFKGKIKGEHNPSWADDLDSTL